VFLRSVPFQDPAQVGKFPNEPLAPGVPVNIQTVVYSYIKNVKKSKFIGVNAFHNELR